MSGQGHAANGAVRAVDGDAAEPDLKRRRLLDAGGPVEDGETARQKMREAKVDEEINVEENYEYTGFDPENISQKRYRTRGGGLSISPMGYFAEKDDLPMMRWLYVNGADTRDEDIDSWFPMLAAAREGNLEACKWLYDHGAASDIKRRSEYDIWSSLYATYDGGRLGWDASKWLILQGALCMDGSSDLDLDLVREDLGDNNFDGRIEWRRKLLEWAKEPQRDREAMLMFMMGTLSPPEYSPLALRELLVKRLQSEKGSQRILEILSSDQLRLLWDDVIRAEKYLSCPASSLCGSSGVLETIGDFVGVVRGREARIIRQLTEILATEFDDHEYD